MDSFGRIVEIIVTAVLLFIVPLNYSAAKQDMIIQTMVGAETAYFADSVRNVGFISRAMYETYLRKLDTTGHVYEIEIIHYRKTAGQLISENGPGGYDYYYYGIYTEDILKEMYQESEDESYYLKQGDYISVKIKNKDKTLFTRLAEGILNRSLAVPQIEAVYGGAVKDEAG